VPKRARGHDCLSDSCTIECAEARGYADVLWFARKHGCPQPQPESEDESEDDRWEAPAFTGGAEVCGLARHQASRLGWVGFTSGTILGVCRGGCVPRGCGPGGAGQGVRGGDACYISPRLAWLQYK
jgi:hypothetical protein